MNFANRLKTARKSAKKTQAQVAEYLNIDTSAVTHWEAGKSQPTAARLEALARFLGVSVGDLLDEPANKAETAGKSFIIPSLSNRKIPVFGTSGGGIDGAFQMGEEVIDYVFCPPGLENVPDVYAIYVQGEAMEPVFYEGLLIWMHPSKPVRPGDDVVIQVANEVGTRPVFFIKRLEKKEAENFFVKQFNPNKQFKFETKNILSCHKIVFAER